MLLVARHVGEALRIGTDIEVKVVASSRSRVLLAVSAPRGLDIRRIYGKSDNKSAPPPVEEAPAPQAAGQDAQIQDPPAHDDAKHDDAIHDDEVGDDETPAPPKRAAGE